MNKSIKLLYVEDDPDIRAIAELALEDEGFEMMMCSSGDYALTVAEDFAPELIILDVMMPGLDGPTTLLELRKFSALKNTPVIFMTAKVQPAEIAEYKTMGALDVICKPFDVMSLADQIKNIMSLNNG